MEFVPEKTVGVNRIKSGIAKEGVRVKIRVLLKEVHKDRFEAGRIANRFIFVRRIGFLFHQHFWMSGFKIIIREGNRTDNAESVGEYGKFVGITEVTVDILLFCVRAGSSLGRHKTICHFVGIDLRVVFVIGFEASDEGMKGFRVVFRDIKLHAGSIKSKHLSKGAVNSLTDGFCKIDHALKHQLNIRKERLFKTGEQWGIRDFGKAVEVPKFPADGEEKDEQGMEKIF